ncbi:MAG TPA: type I DNA topoisomerase [Caldithrix abyssi]|uniref:DNA topoisomerase 1 n=1 Tax=Caldithrix abyssi TaxID=187145 RepID=A0A7V4TX42_CALAY|nr:type I DNA topoisomerase [Caldithrix abyssi]
MAKQSLVIVESPAKAKTINKYLGRGFKVSATVGHVIDLPKSKLGVSVEEGFKPQYVKIRGKEKVIKELRELAKKSSHIYIATDPDREGEAIAYHISTLLTNGDEKSIRRVEFNEITQRAVETAMNSPREIDMARVYSQQARRVLDRLVGYKISPVLWQMIYRGLSAGRVQSVALRLICEREEEIRNFKPEEFWTIAAMVKQDNSAPFQVKLNKIGGKKARISNREQAEEHTAAIRAASLILSAITKKEVKRQPGPPFITSTLQQVAARMLRMSTKRIMSIAQGLYEGVDIPGQGSVGLITYMRTDSTRISQEALGAVSQYIRQQFGEEYGLPKARYFKTKAGAQDAHEAIRPTYITPEFSPEALKPHLSREQFNLYNLIWKRFVACQMAPALVEKTTLTVSGDKYELTAEGEVIKFPGYMRVYKETEENNGNGNQQLPDNLQEGGPCQLVDLKAEQNFTKPTPRYTESTLVKELDRLGIGRPSTYAQIVSTILQRKYVSLEERKLHATELGETVNRILVENFPTLFSVSFTAEMEKELDDIASRKATYEEVMDNFYKPFKEAVERLETRKKEVKENLQEEAGELCEKCGRPMIIRWGRNGRFMACSGFPECKNTKPLNEQEAPQQTDEICEKCGSPMVIKQGRFGAFLACSNYPKCKNTKPLSTGVKCPKEGCDGEIVQRKSKRGRVFYGCSNYPKCDFVSWDKPVNKKCPSCGNNYMVEKILKSKGEFLRCPECKFELFE